MEALRNPLFMTPFACEVVGLIVLVVTFSRNGLEKLGRKEALIVASPSLVMLAMFYALAGHMYLSLGEWPMAIGTDSFPMLLMLHADGMMCLFYVLFMLTVFIWPGLFFVSLICERIGMKQLAIHAVSFAVCFGAMLLAPKAFLNWWWD
jgi:hypothetical protein